jgi:hypothetical protein
MAVKLELQVLEVCRRLREVGSQDFYEVNNCLRHTSEDLGCVPSFLPGTAVD